MRILMACVACVQDFMQMSVSVPVYNVCAYACICGIAFTHVCLSLSLPPPLYPSLSDAGWQGGFRAVQEHDEGGGGEGGDISEEWCRLE